jgi:nucleoside-diphosphate-sugar epimerase
MPKEKYVACVTGATGIIGKRIVRLLLESKNIVRVATRKRRYMHSNAEVYTGDILDEAFLDKFIAGADFVFHCAAELNDESKMWGINIEGTRKILKAAKDHKISFFCHMSSAGVVGRTKIKSVDERTTCRPQNNYEKSKWEAEKLAAKGIEGCQMVILRPTNVIDREKPGAVGLAMENSFYSRIVTFIRGGECSHIIHAEDVADAAMYFVSHQLSIPRCFFVSCDHEPLNTFAGLWSLYNAIQNRKPVDSVRPVKHLPIFIPFILRRIVRGHSNKGDVRYSSKKLLSEGFKFTLGLEGAIKRVINTER